MRIVDCGIVGDFFSAGYDEDVILSTETLLKGIENP